MVRLELQDSVGRRYRFVQPAQTLIRFGGSGPGGHVTGIVREYTVEFLNCPRGIVAFEVEVSQGEMGRGVFRVELQSPRIRRQRFVELEQIRVEIADSPVEGRRRYRAFRSRCHCHGVPGFSKPPGCRPQFRQIVIKQVVTRGSGVGKSSSGLRQHGLRLPCQSGA